MRSYYFVFVLMLFLVLAPTNLSHGQDQGPEVFLINVVDSKPGSFLLGPPKNISNNPGYDNQPGFSFNNNSVLYVSSRNGKPTDVFEYFIATGQTVQLTSTEAGEYSPRAVDANHVSFVREGKDTQVMTVIKYNRASKQETPALHVKEPIGYYAWNYKGDALVWVRYAFMVRWVNSVRGINSYVSDYALPSMPQQVPGTSLFSFMHRQPNDEVWIKEFDPNTRSIRPIIQPKDGKRDYCWMNDGSLLIGSGSKLYRYSEKDGDKDWKMVADLSSSGIKGISRMATSFDGKYLALVGTK